MELMDMLLNRRSVRTYGEGEVTDEQLGLILDAALAAPSSKGIRPWSFIVVRGKEALEKLSGFRQGSGKMLLGASCAVVVLGDHEKADMWIEDCALAMGNMHLMASTLGLGSCWIHGRGRFAADGRPSEDFIRETLGVPDNMSFEAVLCIGPLPADPPAPHTRDELLRERVHWQRWE